MKYEKHLSSLKTSDTHAFAEYVKNHRPAVICSPRGCGAKFQYRVNLAQNAHKTDLFRTANLALKYKILEAKEEEFQRRSRSVA